MIGRPLSPMSFAGARRRGRRRGLVVGAAVGAAAANSRRGQVDEAEPAQYDAPAQDDTVAQLEKLADLKSKGILTEEEFAAEKAKILG